MGSSSSTNRVYSRTDILSKIMTDITAQQMTDVGASNIIKVEGGKGDLNISGNVQENRVTVNLKGVADMMSSQQAQQKLVQDMTQAATASTSGINFGNSSNTNNEMNLVTNATLNMSTHMGQICDAMSKSDNEIVVTGQVGNVNLTSNIQRNVSDVVADCAMKATGSQAGVQDVETKLEQSATSKTVGLDPFAFLQWLILGFIVILALGMLGGMAGLSGASSMVGKVFTVFLWLLALGALGGGIALLVLRKTQLKEYQMTGTQYSSLIAHSCHGTPIVVEGPTPNMDAASNLCYSSAECTGFDWEPEGQPRSPSGPAAVRFYKDVTADNCHLGQQTLQVTDVMRTAQFYIHQQRDVVNPTSDPAYQNNPTYQEGDVLINAKDGSAYWLTKTAEGIRWYSVGQVPTPGTQGWKEGIALRVSGTGVPDDAIGKDNDLWLILDVANPTQTLVYQRQKGSYGYVPPPGSSSKPPPAGVNPGVVWIPDYAAKANLNFPGQYGSLNESIKNNWSGLKVRNLNYDYYFYGGISLVVLGGLGLLGLIVSSFMGSSTQPASTEEGAKPGFWNRWRGTGDGTAGGAEGEQRR